MNERARIAARSLAARLALVALAFAAVPLILYSEFSAAEEAKRRVLLERLQTEGALIAGGLRLGLDRLKGPSVVETRKLLERLDPKGLSVRLLFRKGESVFLVAALPPLDAAQVEAERERLVAAGIAGRVPESCDGGRVLDLDYRTASGHEEVLVSVVPLATRAGCWAVVASQAVEGVAGSLLGRPYWKSPEIMVAAGVYALLAVLVLSVIGGLWINLRRFGRAARLVGGGGTGGPSFAGINRIPELDGVARELDRMVGNLVATAQAFRFAAEENAHAFKTPIATIAQSVEPLRRSASGHASAARSLQLIEAAVERLDALVAASRRLDQVNADLVSPPRQKVDLSRLVSALLESYDEQVEGRSLRIERRITPCCAVNAGIEMMETVIENILDNAISFSPPGGTVAVTVAKGDRKVALVIDDQGPGASDEVLESMFERYVSHRPDADPSGQPHFGIGLWITRRNVAAIGGTVEARNRDGGGLRVTVTLPAA